MHITKAWIHGAVMKCHHDGYNEQNSMFAYKGLAKTARS